MLVLGLAVASWMSVQDRFLILSAGMEKTPQFSPKGAQTHRCHEKDWSFSWHLLSCYHVLYPYPMEAKGAETLFSDGSDPVHEPHLKAGSKFRQEKA